MRSLLKRYLHVATVMTGTSKSEKDAVLAQKLHGMGKGIMKLLHDAAHDHPSVGHLLTELEMLRVFLDRNGARTSMKGDRRRDGELPTLECNGRGRDFERAKQRYPDDAIFTNPAPFRSPARQPTPKRAKPEPELTGRGGRDWDGEIDPCRYPASYQSQGHSRHDDYRYSESPRGRLEYQGRWRPETGRDDFGHDHPSQRMPKPKPSPRSREERDRRSSGPESYPSHEARQDDDHDQRSEGYQPRDDDHEDEVRLDGRHEERQNSHSPGERTEDGAEAYGEGAEARSGADGEGPESGHEPEDGGNVSGTNDD